jgi:hypothetical protein
VAVLPKVGRISKMKGLLDESNFIGLEIAQFRNQAIN